LNAESGFSLNSKMNNQRDRLVLGLNYSGVHDSAVALVRHSGEVVSACALERLSRAKQDGRPPDPLLAHIDWDAIETIAVSTEEWAWSPAYPVSTLHPKPLSAPRDNFLVHEPPFYDFLDKLPRPKRFVCHHLSHAASAFWLSGFEEALCLTYDGGIFNSPWFGGLYRASRAHGLEPLDRFPASHYAKITSLYTIVTALLGFSPNKHEGKITGLAAYGCPNSKCRDLLEELFTVEIRGAEEVSEWFHSYSSQIPPALWVHEPRRQELLARFEGLRREDVAHAVQQMAEEHVAEILRRARNLGWRSPAICLAGGLFANVKVNQRVKETGFQQIFIAPPMTDDGTALGAALMVASETPEFSPKRASHMFFGPAYGHQDVERALATHGLRYTKLAEPERYLAEALSRGAVVGVYQGRMEFGPRALGNRSILSAATDPDINRVLNARLRRTEFMPFAPITRFEDARHCYTDLDGAEHTAEFMTITSGCTDQMRRQSPAVVHVDGTARPQLVRRETHPLLHGILTAYQEQTGILSLINTSFNVHEEPIVCAPDDAIQGFLEAGLDLLYLDGGYLVSFAENTEAALEFLRRQMASASQKERALASAARVLDERADGLAAELEARTEVIDTLQRAVQGLLERAEGLERTAAERLAGMEALESAAADRLAAMHMLTAECTNKDQAIEEHHRRSAEIQQALARAVDRWRELEHETLWPYLKRRYGGPPKKGS